MNLEEVSQKKTFLGYCPPRARNLANFFPFEKVSKSIRIGVSPLQFVQCPKEGVFFSGIPSLITVKIIIIMTVIMIMIIIMIMTVKILCRLMVVGAWLLTLVLASPQVNKQVQNVPKKVPNRNTCCRHSLKFEIIRKEPPLLISIFIRNFFGTPSSKPISYIPRR